MNNKEEKEMEQKKLEEIIELVKQNLEDNTISYNNLDSSIMDEYLQYLMLRTYDNKIKNLKRALSNPYFARIDFQELNTDKLEKFYIGKTNVFDDDLNVVVVDWRAPISSIYYDGQIGEVEYNCPEGNIKVQLYKKRQYLIENAKLLGFEDIDIITNDELLQEYLNENSDSRLKNIVATIQSEQNRIIRANMFKPLIVQGVAGSGKTTVALHRIAYLVYTYEKNFKPEDFLIIAPNKLFLNYISNVLPDLGVDYVRQQTFEEFALEIIKDNISIENPNTKLANIVNLPEEAEFIIKVSRIKSSMGFKEIIDRYLRKLNNTILPQEDFKIADIVIFSREELQNIFMNNHEKICIKQRINILSSYMKKKIADMSDSIINSITDKRSEKINKIDTNLSIEEQQSIRRKIFEETEYEISDLIKGGRRLVTDYIKKIKIYKSIEYYKFIMQDKQLFNEFINSKIIEYMMEEFQKRIKRRKIEYEDLTALLYIQFKIFGLEEKFSLKHIVIDEAQDFSEFQFWTLNEVLQRNKSLTILGDIAQGIYSYRGSNDWDRVNKLVFNEEASIQRLNNSYRTTAEIMNEANKILKKLKTISNIDLAIPISRHGEEVKYIKTNNLQEKSLKINDRINELLKKGYKNIAIICKELSECKEIFYEMKKINNNINIVTEDITDYKGGIIIIPSYFSKGLEFDSVIISDYNKYKDSDLDIKLLYVAYTRAMHTLDVFI